MPTKSINQPSNDSYDIIQMQQWDDDGGPPFDPTDYERRPFADPQAPRRYLRADTGQNLLSAAPRSDLSPAKL